MKSHIDLFSGIGGFALAASWAGYHTEVFCERDEFCRKVLEKRFPGVPVVPDIFDFDGAEYAGADLLTGGFPCQPYSCAGKRLGAEDDRALWPQMLRVVSRVRPRWVVAENVAGFVGMALDDVLSDLEKEGYQTGAVVLPACAVDAPHRRDRVWIVAHAYSIFSISSNQNEDVASERNLFSIGGRGKSGSSSVCIQEQHHSSESRRDERIDSDGIAQSRLGRVADGIPTRLDRPFDREPDVPRVAVGIKQRRERLKSLGNAIVPQVAYHILVNL